MREEPSENLINYIKMQMLLMLVSMSYLVASFRDQLPAQKGETREPFPVLCYQRSTVNGQNLAGRAGVQCGVIFKTRDRFLPPPAAGQPGGGRVWRIFQPRVRNDEIVMKNKRIPKSCEMMRRAPLDMLRSSRPGNMPTTSKSETVGRLVTKYKIMKKHGLKMLWINEMIK